MKKCSIIAILTTICGLGLISARADDGATIYNKNCAACHGKEGKGDTKMGQKLECKDYTAPAAWEGLDDAKAFRSVKEGITEDGKTKMKAFGSKLSDDEIKAAIAHLKSFKK